MRWLAYYAIAGAICGLLGQLAASPSTALALGVLTALTFALLETTSRLGTDGALRALYTVLLGGGAIATGSHACPTSDLSAALTGSVMLPATRGAMGTTRRRPRA